MNGFVFPGAIDVSGVIHVGACRGEELQEHISLGAKKIVWVEANPYLYKELCENVKNSEIENLVFSVACSNVDDEKVKFNLIYDNENKGCSSLFDLMPGNMLSNMSQETIEVDTITIDTLLRRNNLNFADFQLLDLDVQGAELLVLNGAKELLKHIKYICVELTFTSPDYLNNPFAEEVIDYLTNEGFKHICNNFYPGVRAWGGGYFIKKEKRDK
jgi:FkbM family methyltransferase